jgi:hypothetical protein
MNSLLWPSPFKPIDRQIYPINTNLHIFVCRLANMGENPENCSESRKLYIWVIITVVQMFRLFPNHHRSITTIQYSIVRKWPTLSLAAVYLIRSTHSLFMKPISLTQLSLFRMLSISYSQPCFFLMNPTESLVLKSIFPETYLLQSTDFLPHETHWISCAETSLSLMKPISYSQSSFFLMKTTESLMLKPLSLSWTYLLQSIVFFSHETHWTFYAENSLSWNLSPTVKRLSFSLNPPNLFWWNLYLKKPISYSQPSFFFM